MTNFTQYSAPTVRPCWCRRILIVVGWYITAIAHQASAQELTITQDTIYQSKVQYLIDDSDGFLQQKNYQRAKVKAQQAFDIARKKGYNAGESESLSQLAKVHRQMGNYLEGVKYNLWAIRTLERVGDQAAIAHKYKEVGYLYFDLRAYAKAIDYFQLYRKAKEKVEGSAEVSAEVVSVINQSHLQLREYIEAQQYCGILLERYKKEGDLTNLAKTYQTLAFISKEKEEFEKAIGFNKELLALYGRQEDVAQIAHTYNNIGFLYKRLGNLKTALEYFSEAVELVDKGDNGLEPNQRVSLLTNVGIAYTNLSLFSRAKEYYMEAMRIKEAQQDPVGEAYIHNHLSSNYFVSGKNAQALKSVITAIDIGITHDAPEVLATSYRILSLIYRADNNESKALLYEEKYQEIDDAIEKEEVHRFEQMLDQQLAIEKQEDEIKALLVDQERQALEDERKESELALKQKELTLLRRDQELQAAALQNQQLEKEKATQALTLAQQQLQAEKRNQELRESERQRQLQDLQLKQQDLEKQQQEKAIALLEADQQLKTQKLREEARLKKFAYGIIGLFVFVMGIIIFSFRQKQRDNKKLQKQQDEIQEKNKQLLIGEKELRRNMKQLQLTQEVLAEQKQQLEVEHRKTQESIHYAQRIQFSILPSVSQRKKIIPNSFVIYRPKDIVSGDFYWISQTDNKTVASVIDCTGHGVPGSLVSLIGNNLLNEAINEHHISNPAEILDYLDNKVRLRFNQDEGNNRDGMDLGLCVIEESGGAYQLTYGGAKNNLMIMKNGQLEVLKGDRKSIGGSKRDFAFTQQTIELQPEDCLYMTTDGFIDQANADRERFGSKRLRALIREVHTLDMKEQGARFEQALDDHQQDTEQRDDINLIGIRI